MSSRPLDCMDWLTCLIRIRRVENVNPSTTAMNYSMRKSTRRISLKPDSNNKSLTPFTHLPGVTDRLINIIVVSK